MTESQAVVLSRYSSFLHHLQLANHHLITDKSNTKIQTLFNGHVHYTKRSTLIWKHANLACKTNEPSQRLSRVKVKSLFIKKYSLVLSLKMLEMKAVMDPCCMVTCCLVSEPFNLFRFRDTLGKCCLNPIRLVKSAGNTALFWIHLKENLLVKFLSAFIHFSQLFRK